MRSATTNAIHFAISGKAERLRMKSANFLSMLGMSGGLQMGRGDFSIVFRGLSLRAAARLM